MCKVSTKSLQMIKRNPALKMFIIIFNTCINTMYWTKIICSKRPKFHEYSKNICSDNMHIYTLCPTQNRFNSSFDFQWDVTISYAYQNKSNIDLLSSINIHRLSKPLLFYVKLTLFQQNIHPWIKSNRGIAKLVLAYYKEITVSSKIVVHTN